MCILNLDFFDVWRLLNSPFLKERFLEEDYTNYGKNIALFKQKVFYITRKLHTKAFLAYEKLAQSNFLSTKQS